MLILVHVLVLVGVRFHRVNTGTCMTYIKNVPLQDSSISRYGTVVGVLVLVTGTYDKKDMHTVHRTCTWYRYLTCPCSPFPVNKIISG